MEDGLVLINKLTFYIMEKNVLILIVVEDGLVHVSVDGIELTFRGLNPYCSGRWSRTC